MSTEPTTPPACTCSPPPTTPSGHRMNCPDWRGGGEAPIPSAATEGTQGCRPYCVAGPCADTCLRMDDPNPIEMPGDRRQRVAGRIRTAREGRADHESPDISLRRSSRIYSGEDAPSARELELYGEACGVTVDWLLTGIPVRPTTEPTAAPDDAHVCKPGGSLYYCPRGGETESDCHGGFDTCCDRPDLHQKLVPCSGAVLHQPHAAHGWAPQPGMDPVHCTGTPGRTETGATTANVQAAEADTGDESTPAATLRDALCDAFIGLIRDHSHRSIIAPGYMADTALAVRDVEMDRLRAALALSRQGATDREALLTEARDALEAAGENGAHGDDWPQTAPAIRTLAGRAEKRRQQLTRAVAIPDDATWLEALVAVVKARLGRERAEAEVARLLAEFPWLRATDEDRQAAEAKVAAVRKLHHPVTWPAEPPAGAGPNAETFDAPVTVCAADSDDPAGRTYWTPWPCDTICALDGAEPTTTNGT